MNYQLAQENIHNNLIQTKAYFIDNKMNDRNSTYFIGLINYALENWNDTNRLKALALLADKEIKLKKNGEIVDAEMQENDGYFAQLYDYLSKLEDKELGLEGFGELGRASREEREKKRQERKDRRKDKREERKENRQERKEERKDKREERKENRQERKEERKDKREERKENRHENGSRSLHNLNRVNPVMVAMRNAFRALVALNIFGFASIFNTEKAKDKGVYLKVVNGYYDLGGEKEKIENAIKGGAKKKVHFNKKIREQLDSGKLSGFSGLGELGEPATIATLIASATAPMLKAWKWIKDAGLDKVIEEIPEIIPDKKPDPDGNARDDPEDNRGQPDNSNGNQPDNSNEHLPQNRNMSNSPEQQGINDDEKKGNKKILIFGGIAVGVIGIGGLSYYLYNKQKNKTLTGITF